MRIACEDQRGIIARRSEQLTMHLQLRDAKARHAALPRAEQIAFAAQPQVFLSDAEAVLAVAQDREACFGGFAERRFVEQQAG